VWAEVAEKAGKVKTQEGTTAYQAGDYLVSNNDGYAMGLEFESMYELAED
jgi:hypothetical protein